jgi:hypothetical protein
VEWPTARAVAQRQARLTDDSGYGEKRVRLDSDTKTSVLATPGTVFVPVTSTPMVPSAGMKSTYVKEPPTICPAAL